MSTIHSQLAKRGWYSSDSSSLKDEIEDYFSAYSAQEKQRPSAIVVPHAGYRYSGQTAASAFYHCRGFDYDKIFIIGPSHYYPLQNAASLPEANAYHTPLGDIEIETSIVKELLRHPSCTSIDDIHSEEHSVQIELPFIQYTCPNSKVVPMVIGKCDQNTIHSLAKLIKPFLTSNSLIVISSDFTHYGQEFGYTPFESQIAANIKALDIKACRHITSGKKESFKTFIDQTPTTICGRDAIKLLMDCFEETPHEGTLLDYARSGDMTADYSHSVSYASILFNGSWQVA